MKLLKVLVLIVALLGAAPAHAAWLCVHASGAEVGAADAATRTVVTTSTGPYIVWSFSNSADQSVFFNTTLPFDVPDAMQWKQMKVHWLKGTATTGTAVWSALTEVYVDGQDFTDSSNYLGPMGDDTVPTGATEVQLTIGETGLVTLPVNIPQASGSACSANPTGCRLSPLRVQLKRQTQHPNDDANGTALAIKVCLEY